MEMDRRELGMRLSQLPPELQQINTPLRVEEWENLLRPHPDRQFCEYLLQGMRRGFRIGFQYPRSCTSTKSNMKSD